MTHDQATTPPTDFHLGKALCTLRNSLDWGLMATANRLGWDPSELNAVERNTRRVTMIELWGLLYIYHIPWSQAPEFLALWSHDNIVRDSATEKKEPES